MGLTAFPAVEGKRIPAILLVALILAPDGIVVQVEKFCDPSTAFPVVEQHDRDFTTGNRGLRADGVPTPQARYGLLRKESRGGSWA